MLNEITGGNLNALLLAPVDRSAVFFGKVFSNFLFLIMMEIITVPIFMVFYNINIFANSLMSIVVLALGTYGFAVLGTLFSLISVKTKTREIMLPLLLLPLMIPIILAGIQCMNIYILGDDVAESYKWLKLIGAFDVIFTAVIYAIFDYIVEE